MSNSNRLSNATRWEIIATVIALVSVILNILQFVNTRIDRREDLARADAVAERQSISDALKYAPNLSFHYWEFKGDNRRICRFFTEDLALSISALKSSGFSAQYSGIHVLANEKAKSIRAKLQSICNTEDPLANDAKNWKFVLVINSGPVSIAITEIKYVSRPQAQSTQHALEIRGGLLIPIGYSLSGRESLRSDYLWPERLKVGWQAGTEPLSKTVDVRRPGRETIGYVLDVDTQSPVYFEPPVGND